MDFSSTNEGDVKIKKTVPLNLRSGGRAVERPAAFSGQGITNRRGSRAEEGVKNACEEPWILRIKSEDPEESLEKKAIIELLRREGKSKGKKRTSNGKAHPKQPAAKGDYPRGSSKEDVES